MAIRLEDEDERISNLAKLFFHELSKKGSNPIYNLLPDILGKLSNQNLERNTFCNIMQFVIGSIKKDKQMEALVEKLCNRFSGVTDTKQWEYISYCLSQLSFTDKGMKKLIESFKTYEHVLCEDSVMDHFKNIINKGKKFAKPDLKSCIEEFEEKINKFHIEKKEQEVTAKNAEVHQQKLRNLEKIGVATEDGEESTESKTSEDGTDSEVTDEVITTTPPCEQIPDSEENSPASSELIEPEPADNEVLSAQVVPTGVFKSRAKKGNIKNEKCDSELPTRSTMSRRRNV